MQPVVAMMPDAGSLSPVQRAYLRPYVKRAGWGAIWTGALGSLLMLVLFYGLTPAEQLLRALKESSTPRALLIGFWIVSGISLLGMLLCGIITLARWSQLTKGPGNAADSMRGLPSMTATQIIGAFGFIAFLGMLAVPPHDIGSGNKSLEILAINFTPPEIIQFIFFAICAALALTLIANRRGGTEVRWTLLGEEAMRRRGGFEVLLTPAQHPGVSATAMPMPSAPLSVMPVEPAPITAILTPPAIPMAPAPVIAIAAPLPQSTFHASPLSVEASDAAGLQHWERLLTATALVVIGLLVTHMWILYQVRSAFKESSHWKELYKEYSEVPKEPGTPQYGYPTTAYYSRPSPYSGYRSQGPTTTEPLAGLAAVVTVGGSVGITLLDALILVWAVMYVIAGPQMRPVAVFIGWMSLSLIVLSWLTHTYLLHAFRFAPERVYELSFARLALSGEFRELQTAASPIDTTLRQLVIPLAIVLLLRGERMRTLFRRRGSGR